MAHLGERRLAERPRTAERGGEPTDSTSGEIECTARTAQAESLHRQDLIDTHHFVIAEYELFSTIEEDENGVPAHDILARCETMLNVTSAAMNLVLSERRDDLRTVAESYLSAQIERHEKVSSWRDQASSGRA